MLSARGSGAVFSALRMVIAAVTTSPVGSTIASVPSTTVGVGLKSSGTTAMPAQITRGKMIVPMMKALVSAVYLNSRHATASTLLMFELLHGSRCCRGALVGHHQLHKHFIQCDASQLDRPHRLRVDDL